MRQPWVIAHRGASGHAPENTMAAFLAAVELGATFIEADLHMTRDAQFVAIHDSTVERTTNGRGAVASLTLTELTSFDAGKWFDRKFAGERIPTLDQVLQLARAKDVVFYLEIKYDAAWGLHRALAAALASSGDEARAVVLSFDATVLEGLRKENESVMTGLLIEEMRPDAVKLAVATGSRQLCPRADLLTPDLVREAHRADLPIVTWTVNQPDQMRRVIHAGVDGVMTDFPDRLFKVIHHLEPKD